MMSFHNLQEAHRVIEMERNHERERVRLAHLARAARRQPGAGKERGWNRRLFVPLAVLRRAAQAR